MGLDYYPWCMQQKKMLWRDLVKRRSLIAFMCDPRYGGGFTQTSSSRDAEHIFLYTYTQAKTNPSFENIQNSLDLPHADSVIDKMIRKRQRLMHTLGRKKRGLELRAADPRHALMIKRGFGERVIKQRETLRVETKKG